MGSCQSSSLSFHVEGPQSAEQCAKALVVAAFSGHVDDPASATHLVSSNWITSLVQSCAKLGISHVMIMVCHPGVFQAELESRWAAVNRNQAVVQALEGIENGEVCKSLGLSDTS